MPVRWFPQRAAVGYSRWTDRSVHLCSKTPHACFHARGSSVRCPLAKALIQCTTSPGELVICGLAPPPSGASLPRADARVRALLQRDSLRSPPPHRPEDVSNLLICYPLCQAKTCHMMEGRDDHSGVALPLLPRDRYCPARHVG